MPWARFTHDRIVSIYRDLFEELMMKSRDVDITIKEVLIRTEVLKRDFTKRQLTILSFIMTFSYYYGKETALIPKLQDFEIAGVAKTKITDELTKLVDLKVIDWIRGKDYNEFSINDPREWRARYNVGYNDPRSKELFFLNLKHAGVKFDIEALIAQAMQD